MTKKTKKNASKSQCMTCGMPSEVQKFIIAMTQEGLPYTRMSAQMHDVYGITISADALSNHIKKHIVVDPLLGVVTPPNSSAILGKDWTPRVELNEDGTGTVVSKPYTNRVITNMKDILVDMDVDPDAFVVIGAAKVAKWEQRAFDKASESFVTVWLSAYRVNIEEVKVHSLQAADGDESASEAVDLPTLYATAKSAAESTEPRVSGTNEDRTTVVVFADPQIGKAGGRGGTPELIERVVRKQQALKRYINGQNSASAVFLDAGDIIEGFENTAQQQTTNDLSLMEQIDLAHTLELEFIDILSKTHTRVDAASVPSNHAAWRRGKDYLGKPGDDWGLHILRQVEKGYDKYMPDHNVAFHYADQWKKSLVLDVQGLGLGLVHGDCVSKPDSIPQWWANQCHGGGPVAKADILVSGHFHTFRLQPSGRNPNTDRQKWWVGAPTLDNGSDWYANGMGGGDSDAGLLVFVIDKNKGFDSQSFAIL